MGTERRGCWEPKPEAAHLNVLSKVLDEAQRVRAARAPVPAYHPSSEPAPRDFVPVDTGADAGTKNQPPRSAPGAVDPPAPVDSPPAYVIEPDPGWGERTTLFGDPES